MTIYYAHSHSDETQPSDKWQPLADHLRGVAQRAERFAADMWGDPDGLPTPTDRKALRDNFVAAARAAGLMHDLGKYRPEFQQMLRGVPPKNELTWHKQAGAAHAAGENKSVEKPAVRRLNIAFAITGHLGGMLDFAELKRHIYSSRFRSDATPTVDIRR